MKTQKVILSLLIVMMSFALLAQDGNNNSPNLSDLAIDTKNYHTAIGVRAGETSGITIKQFTGSNHAVEGIVGFWKNGLSGTLLYEKYVPAFEVPGLNWYYGAGGHAVFYTGYTVYNNRLDMYERNSSDLGLGIDGILGMEYKIIPIPFAVSLDFKPFVEVNTSGNVWMSIDPALGLKLVF